MKTNHNNRKKNDIRTKVKVFLKKDFNNICKKILIVLAIIAFYILILYNNSNYCFANESKINNSNNLYNLIAAELAKKRNLPKIALKYYMAIAQNNKNPKIAKKATKLAIELQEIKFAKESASLWAELEQNSFQANMVATTLFISEDQNKAKQYIAKAIKISPLEIQNHFFNVYLMLSKESKKNFSKILLELSEEDKQNPYLQITTANIIVQENKIEQANILTNNALKIKPDLTEGIKLKAKLIRNEHDKDEPALKYLDKKVKQFPKNAELRLFLASALIDSNDLKDSIAHLKKVATDQKFGGEALLTLGKIFLEKNQLQKAKNYFKKLENFEIYWPIGKYFLGTIAEREQNLKQAIKWYSKVKTGIYHTQAFTKAALLLTLENKFEEAITLLDNANPYTLGEQKEVLLTQIEILIEAGQYDQALNNINIALEVIPNDIDFLYTRSLIAGYLNNLELAEKDLSTILSLNPNNHTALNALGYTLSHKPKRYKEALTYIKKAINLSPNNPYYMDSMGWLLFQMGKIDEAIKMLDKAYQLSKDVDIVIHLSKVLWASGKHKKAISILNKALNNNPNNEILKNILNNFKHSIKNEQIKITNQKSNI